MNVSILSKSYITESTSVPVSWYILGIAAPYTG